jgi:hypothetical protein
MRAWELRTERGPFPGRAGTVATLHGSPGAHRLRCLLAPERVTAGEAREAPPHDVLLARTDGWISLPDWPLRPRFHPDSLAPPPFTTYVTGLRNVTGLTAEQRAGQRSTAQCSAPILWLDPRHGADVLRVGVVDLGAGVQPWRRGRAPSLERQAGATTVCALRPAAPGTYLYQLHPGADGAASTGMVIVGPRQNGDRALHPGGRFVHDDGDGSSGYHREYVLVLSEVCAEASWNEARARPMDLASYRVDFALLNGRVWPDTLLPGGAADPFHPVMGPAGEPLAPGGARRLLHQPYSSLVACNAGEEVLLRLANLGRRDATLRLDGARLRVVGRNGERVREAGGHLVTIGAGEVVEAIFTAPPHSGQEGPDRHDLRRCAPARGERPGDALGGQRTEVRVHPAQGPGALPPQAVPHG